MKKNDDDDNNKNIHTYIQRKIKGHVLVTFCTNLFFYLILKYLHFLRRFVHQIYVQPRGKFKVLRTLFI